MNPISVYDTFDRAYPWIIRGTNQQTDLYLLAQPPATSQASRGGLPTRTTERQNGLRLGGISLHNRSGGVCAVGIGVRIQNHLWKAGQWVDSTTTYTDDTTDAQDAGTSDFPIETTTDSTGFVILSRVPINGISINVGTASVDATDPARSLTYSTGAAGHTWSSALTNLFSSTGAAAEMATGENAWVWALPVDHMPTTIDDTLGTGIPKGYYAVRIMATTAPDTTAAVATTIEVYRFFHLTEALADNGVYEAFYGTSELKLSSYNSAEGTSIEYGDAVVAYFSVLNVQNRVTGFVRTAG